ncbi:MAG: hypothetical protein KIT14_09560 [bacterium]|nr:hypothetical protein [bacterium]
MTRLRRAAVWAVLWVALVGHGPERTPSREIVRLQGHRSAGAAADAGGATALVVSALGTDHPFAVSDLRTFGFAEQTNDDTVGQKVVLQGSRELLSRFANARPEQTVTILAERRSGSSDLFLLALDLCPPH